MKTKILQHKAGPLNGVSQMYFRLINETKLN
jgi:hypothetical protein